MDNHIPQNFSDKSHHFHLVNPSVWPILTSFSLLVLASGGVLFFHYKNMLSNLVLIFGFLAVFFCVFCWWRDVIREGIHDKAHTHVVQQGLRIGMALFILSEIMFFGAFFGAFFKSMLDPVQVLDGVWPAGNGIWPPKNIKLLDVWNVPLINTLILLLSGTTVTWAHYSLHDKKYDQLIQGLGITILLGLSFTVLQILEYFEAPFKFKDGIYASNFYMATGFHGLHVIIGTFFLFICYLRAKKGHFIDSNNSLALEFAAWYWHFVDVIWLFLYIFVYLLGR